VDIGVHVLKIDCLVLSVDESKQLCWLGECLLHDQ
jgi:hypothetical protein